jgi:hypothetical protein
MLRQTPSHVVLRLDVLNLCWKYWELEDDGH